MPRDAEAAAVALYQRLIDAWNAHDAAAMAAALAVDGLVIGFDGSEMTGRAEVSEQLAGIFADHETATYVTKVRSVTMLDADTAVLHAVAGMVPPGGSEVMPDRNSVQTVVAHRAGDACSVALFQTTPARYDGRAELAEALTGELNAQLHD
jgi:uncharacterized protein (TIGR02246 family)